MTETFQMQKCSSETMLRKGMRYTYQVANVGSKSVTTRIIYKTHVSNLKNKFAIRIRRPFSAAAATAMS